MNVQILTNDSELSTPIKEYFLKKKVNIFEEESIDKFFISCTQNPSNLFLIQNNIDTQTRMMDFIRDLRMYFGAFPIIFIFGKKNQLVDQTNFFNVGADDVITSPYDLPILEDYLGRSLHRDNFLPIHYRNVPSGGSPVTIFRNIALNSVTTEGIEFLSTDFYARATIFSTESALIFNFENRIIRYKVIASEKLDDGNFSYFAEFHELDNDTQKMIYFDLKKK